MADQVDDTKPLIVINADVPPTHTPLPEYPGQYRLQTDLVYDQKSCVLSDMDLFLPEETICFLPPTLLKSGTNRITLTEPAKTCLPSWFRLIKGPVSEAEARTFCLFQDILQLFGQPFVRCFPLLMRRFLPVNNAGYVTPSSETPGMNAKPRWFIAMECLYEKVGYPHASSLITYPHIPRITPLVNHQRTSMYVEQINNITGVSDDGQEQIALAYLTCYLFGLDEYWSDVFFVRNQGPHMNQVFHLNATQFSHQTHNPIGHYLLKTERKANLSVRFPNLVMHPNGFIQTLAHVLPLDHSAQQQQQHLHLRSILIKRMNAPEDACIWSTSPFGNWMTFLACIRQRLAFILGARISSSSIEFAASTGPFYASITHITNPYSTTPTAPVPSAFTAMCKQLHTYDVNMLAEELDGCDSITGCEDLITHKESSAENKVEDDSQGSGKKRKEAPIGLDDLPMSHPKRICIAMDEQGIIDLTH